MPSLRQVDIAKRLGVSRQAVGCALGLYPDSNIRLRPETRQRIVDAARRLGYRPHRQAQIMRGAKSGVVGMIQFGGLVQMPAQRAAHVASAIHRAGYQILTNDVGWYSEGVSAACSAMLDARVEGVVIVSPAGWFPDAELQRLRSATVPVVFLSGVRMQGVPQVTADPRQGMADLTSHLLRVGHRRLAMLASISRVYGSDPAKSWSSLDRLRGFCETIEAAGGTVSDTPRDKWSTDPARIEAETIINLDSENLSDPYKQGKDAMRGILQRAQRPQVVLCGNDDWAIGALAACGEAGVRVPQDIAVTGFDNTLVGGYGMVPLTTVEQPLEAMAREVMRILVKLIRGEKLSAGEQLVRLPCRLVVRESCGALLLQKEAQRDKGESA